MEGLSIDFGVAFLAGLASFLSPCVLSLVPAYVSYLGGRAAGGEVSGNKKWITFAHGIAFVFGFSSVFIIFNIIAAAVGVALYDFRSWVAKIGGLIIIIFGLHMTGIFRLRFLEYDLRIHKSTDKQLGYLSSFLMGIFFSAGWSPCVGPTLGLIMTFAVNTGDVLRGSLLGIFYSAGMAIPFLLAALGIGWVTLILRKYSKVMRITELIMGILMIIIGIMLVMGVFNLLATLTPVFNFGL